MSDTAEDVAVFVSLLLVFAVYIGIPLFVLWLIVKVIKYAWTGDW